MNEEDIKRITKTLISRRKQARRLIWVLTIRTHHVSSFFSLHVSYYLAADVEGILNASGSQSIQPGLSFQPQFDLLLDFMLLRLYEKETVSSICIIIKYLLLSFCLFPLDKNVDITF